MAAQNHSGKRFGRLIALGRVAVPGRRTLYRCVCDCGAEIYARGDQLVTGNTRSCGCLTKEYRPAANRTHGETRSRTWRSWQAMLNRCFNPDQQNYRNYGARGVTVCDRWRVFANFLADMGLRPEGTTLDRWPNGNGNYEPGNCRWASSEEQANNRRSNVFLEHDGRRLTISQWAHELGVAPGVLSRRLAAGWTPTLALTAPVRRRAAQQPCPASSSI